MALPAVDSDPLLSPLLPTQCVGLLPDPGPRRWGPSRSVSRSCVHSASAEETEESERRCCGCFFPVCKQKLLHREEISVAVLKRKIVTQVVSPAPAPNTLLGRLGQRGAWPAARSAALGGGHRAGPARDTAPRHRVPGVALSCFFFKILRFLLCSYYIFLNRL